jgi:hypothetical protein
MMLVHLDECLMHDWYILGTWLRQVVDELAHT